MRAQGIRFFRVNFCSGIRFLVIFDKKCVIFDKSEKVTYLLKIFKFGTLKVMKTCPVIRFLGTFYPGIRFFGEIVPCLGFALAADSYLPLLGSPPLEMSNLTKSKQNRNH